MENDTEYVFITTVTDFGIGISKERLKYLFKPFRELRKKQSMSKVKDNSIGIGLSCSKLIIQAMKGSIKVLDSKPGKSSIQVKIPVNVQNFDCNSKSELNIGSEYYNVMEESKNEINISH